MTPLVSVITPTIRPHLIERAKELFLAQDYPNKELIIIPGGGSVGEKRNRGCEAAEGDIILHMDDDDFYSSAWISKSVEFLLSTGAEITGLSSAYFYQDRQKRAYKWNYNGGSSAMQYVCEATMCYYRRIWERRQFRNVTQGEGIYFLAHLPNIKPHSNISDFVAHLHDNNTASHKEVRTFEVINPEIVTKILSL